jgi:hypothetical protein
MRLLRSAAVLSLSLAAAAGAQQAAPQPPILPSAPAPSPLPGLVYDVPFFPGANYDPAVPNPASILGFPTGQKPAMHAQIEAIVKALAEKSPRAKLFEYAKSHEGRTLYYLAVSSEANIKRLDQIKADLGKLADPRSISNGDADRLLDSTPAVAWMAYVIHGDEISGSDAALALAYHLAACTDEPVKKLLDQVVVLIDPVMNPDGRDRFITMINQNRTVQPGVDDQSLLHTGFWPQGRTNHYLFDMNRDWMFGVQPESRGRIMAAGSWHPQYFMESHEMGSQDTFLFNPPREPVNAHVPQNIRKWWDVFSKDQAAAFDAHGWRYYTGEWNEELYPGYSGSWSTYRGAIDNLYEQAKVSTDAVRRGEGTLMAYRETVHHQLTSSWANINTLAVHRREVLGDFLAERRAAVAADSPYAGRTFAIVPSANAARLAGFMDVMRLQGFEVFQAGQPFKASGRDRLGRPVAEREFPVGTILVPNRQPEARLVAAMLEFQSPLTTEFLTDERKELLRFHRSKLYDITAWNLTMLHDLEAFELASPMPQGATPFREPGRPPADEVAQPYPPTAYIFDGDDDRSVAAAGRLMERGVQVRCADKMFEFGGRKFARNSVLITRADNQMTPGDLGGLVDQAATELGLAAARVWTGLGPGDLPDIGGEHFILLTQPRVAVVGRDPVDAYAFGEAWHLLDRVLGVRASFLSAADLSGMDLRRYNVLVVPSGGADAIKDKLDSIREWVKAGGTLIAEGSACAPIAADKTGIGGARLLSDVLTKLDDYTVAVAREWEGMNAAVDAEAVWSFSPPTELKYPWSGDSKPEKLDDDEAKRRDKWRAIFMPQGALLAGRVDDRHWLTGGCGAYVPVIFQSDTVLMAAGDVQAPVRLGALVPAEKKPEDENAKDAKGHKPEPAKPSDKGRPNDKKADQPKDKDQDAQDEEKGDKKEDKKPVPWAPTPEGYELRLRMSGLLWPEAADRLANTPYVTREAVGNGQVILFASTPTFRGSAKGTSRIFANAMILGPGMGAQAPIKP